MKRASRKKKEVLDLELEIKKEMNIKEMEERKMEIE